jgi:hypothetical protein
MRWWLVALPGLAACGPQPAPCYCGYSLDVFFPFDGQRTWEFVNDDPSVPYHVIATLDPDFAEREGGAMQVYTIHYTVACVGDDPACVDEGPFRVRSIQMSSDRAYGTLLHSVDLGSGIEVFEPPVMLTDGMGDVGQLWETDSNGITWASVYAELGDCDVPYTHEWSHCLTLLVDDDANAETRPTAHPLHGEWVAVTGYNVVQFQWRDDPQPWRLLTQTWQPIEDL